MLCICSGSDYS